MSKIRYGLQLYGKVRFTAEDVSCANFKAIQLVQNDLLQLLNGTKVKDQVCIKSILDKFSMLSVKQLNAQIKLLEMWKSINLKDHSLR